MKLKLTDDAIYESFKEFYSDASNSADLTRHTSTKDYKTFGNKAYLRIAANPKKAFLSSAKEFFYETDVNFCLNDELKDYLTNAAFIQHLKDIIDYRTRKFYKERLEKQDENL